MDATIGVIGLGAIGSQTLLQLSLAGVSAMGFDRVTSPNDRSGHAGETRLILATPEGPEGEAGEQLTAGAVDAWERYERTTGHRVLLRNGGLVIGHRDEERMSFALDAAKRNPETAKVYSSAELREDYPQFALDADDVAVFDSRSGGVRSEWAVAGAVSVARKHGATTRTCEEVLGWTDEPAGVRVYTTARDYRFERIVVTVGGYVRHLLPSLPVNARRLAMAWFAPETEHQELFHPRRLPIFSWGMPNRFGDMIYGAPSPDEPYVKIGGDFNWGFTDRVTDGDFAAAWDDLAGLRAKARDRFNFLTDSVVRSVKLLDGWSEDQMPLIGNASDSDRVLIAAGFSGYGFMISPIMGEQLADLVTTGASQIDLSGFSPSRFPNWRTGAQSETHLRRPPNGS